MLKLCLLTVLLLTFAQGQYYPAQPPPPIGFLPIYIQNQTFPNRTSYYNNNSVHNGYGNYGGGACKPTQFDLPGSHSLFAGCLQAGDVLLLEQLVDKPSRFFSVREKIIEYPNATTPPYISNKIITAIRCYDLKGHGKGGYARIANGGVNQYRVKLNLTSMERNKALYFRVQIYGR